MLWSIARSAIETMSVQSTALNKALHCRINPDPLTPPPLSVLPMSDVLQVTQNKATRAANALDMPAPRTSARRETTAAINRRKQQVLIQQENRRLASKLREVRATAHTHRSRASRSPDHMSSGDIGVTGGLAAGGTAGDAHHKRLAKQAERRNREACALQVEVDELRTQISEVTYDVQSMLKPQVRLAPP